MGFLKRLKGYNYTIAVFGTGGFEFNGMIYNIYDGWMKLPGDSRTVHNVDELLSYMDEIYKIREFIRNPHIRYDVLQTYLDNVEGVEKWIREAFPEIAEHLGDIRDAFEYTMNGAIPRSLLTSDFIELEGKEPLNYKLDFWVWQLYYEILKNGKSFKEILQGATNIENLDDLIKKYLNRQLKDINDAAIRDLIKKSKDPEISLFTKCREKIRQNYQEFREFLHEKYKNATTHGFLNEALLSSYVGRLANPILDQLHETLLHYKEIEDATRVKRREQRLFGSPSNNQDPKQIITPNNETIHSPVAKERQQPPLIKPDGVQLGEDEGQSGEIHEAHIQEIHSEIEKEKDAIVKPQTEEFEAATVKIQTDITAMLGRGDFTGSKEMVWDKGSRFIDIFYPHILREQERVFLRKEEENIAQFASKQKRQLKVLKILLVGDAGIGKTAFLHQLIDQQFVDTGMTFGFELRGLTFPIAGEEVFLQCYDFQGSYRVRPLLAPFMSRARGVFLFVDLTRMSSVNLEEWLELCRANNNEIPVILCGMKADLREERSITSEYARSLLEPLKMTDFIEVSAKDHTSVHRAMELLVHNILKRSGTLQ